MDEKKTRPVTITRACRQIVDGKMAILTVGQTIDLPLTEASHLIALNKAVAGSQKIEAEKPAPKK